MPRKTKTQLSREIKEILAQPKTPDPHQLARAASEAAYREATPQAHQRAAEAFRASARQHRTTGDWELSDYQEKNAQMHEKEAKSSQFDWAFVASAVQDAAESTPRRFGNPTTGYQVFVADAFRTLTPAARAAIGTRTLAEFKQLLANLNKRRLINLVGSDDPGIWVNNGRTAKDRSASQRLVQESEIDSLGHLTHFISVGR